jgi:hypothetical protein
VDDFVLNVRQIGNYPEATFAGPNDLLLLQQGGLGGPYAAITAQLLVLTGASAGGDIQLAVGGGLQWPDGKGIAYDGQAFNCDGPFHVQNSAEIAGTMTVGGVTVEDGNAFIGGTCEAGNFIIASSNPDPLLAGGQVATTAWVQANTIAPGSLTTADIVRAGGLPQVNPAMAGVCTAPTIWNPEDNSNAIATTAWVQSALCAWYEDAAAVGALVVSFNGRGGAVILNADDITEACTQPGVYAMANTAPSGDASNRIATTAFVDDATQNVLDTISSEVTGLYAPINSPAFTGNPTAPTMAQTDSSGNLATTSFVHAAVVASTTGVSSFNTRTGAVTLTTADITGAGGAPLASPVFTGTPAAPTAVPGTSTTQIATTAFVGAAVSAASAVSSFNTRTGAITLTTADVTGAGGAPLANPTFTGAPAAPTASLGTSTTQLATTAFVANAITALPAHVNSFNSRTGAVSLQLNDVTAVGGAPLASPAFTGSPTAPTPAAGNNSTQIATTAFVAGAVATPLPPRNYIGGFKCSSAASSGVLTIGAGECTDSTNTVAIINTNAAFTKNISGVWAAGSGQPGVASGAALVANGWCHVYACLVGGVFDVFFDTAYPPVHGPTGMTNWRRIMSFVVATSGTQIQQFIQHGDEFWIVGAVLINVTTGSSVGWGPVTVIAPPGINAECIFDVFMYAPTVTTNATIYFGDPNLIANTQRALVAAAGTAVNFQTRTPPSNTSSALQYAITVNAGSIEITVTQNGYVDRRGQDL